MHLLEIKEHASEFSRGDYVLVAHRNDLGPDDLFAIGHLHGFGAYGYTVSISSSLKRKLAEKSDDYTISIGSNFKRKLVEKSDDYWEYALKIPSDLSLNIQKILKENT